MQYLALGKGLMYFYFFRSKDFPTLEWGLPLSDRQGFQSSRAGTDGPARTGTGGFTSLWESLPLPVGRVGTAFSAVPGEVKYNFLFWPVQDNN